MLRTLIQTISLTFVAAINPMQEEMQAYIDSVSNLTGYAISVGFHNDTLDFGIGSGAISNNATVNTTGTDTMLLGSGTKPYTAAAIMRLVD